MWHRTSPQATREAGFQAASPQTHRVVDAPLLLQEQLVLAVVIVQALQARGAQTT